MDKKIIKKAVDEFDTPLYFYDGNKIQDTYLDLRRKLHSSVDIYYSMKSNPTLGVCETLREVGSNCEVCSFSEMIVALKSGFEPNEIIFVGPGKSMRELEYCIDKKIKAIVCESIDELFRLNNIARKHKVMAPILLRINPKFSAKRAPLKMGGRPTQFGIDISILEKNISKIKNYSNLKILGIHIYNGTRILDEETIVENTKNILSLAKTLSREWEIEFECIDLGGGLGIPYFEGEKSLDVEKLMLKYNEEIKKFLKSHPKTKFILEAGRYLVGMAGFMVGSILSIKESHSEKFIINDAGMNCHMAASGLGSFVKRNFPIELIPKLKRREDPKELYNIVGPLCTPGDVIGKNVTLSKARVGDLIVVKNSGAYGPTASPVNFLSHGFPAEALLLNDKVYLVRKREKSENILLHQLSIGSRNQKQVVGENVCQ